MNVWARDLSLYLGQLVAAVIVIAAMRAARALEQATGRDYPATEGPCR